MLRQGKIAFQKQLGAIDHGMHEKIFSLWHMSDFIPCENLIHRKAVTILHNFLSCSTLFLINEIADKKVHCSGAFYQILQCFQYFLVRLLIYPVITVNNLEIKPLCVVDSCIYSATMTKVWLVDGSYDSRIFLLISICNLCSSILGAVINYQNLHFLASWQKRLDTFFHICF